jgi:hypothetical protein
MTQPPVERISIPPRDIPRQAGKIVLDALREAGIDPRKAYNVPMIRALVQAWGRSEIGREEFISSCRKILILNSSIRL